MRCAWCYGVGAEYTRYSGVSSLPVGERDAQILKVRQKLFGDAMSCLVRCPDCGQSVEFVLRGSDFLAASRSERPEEIAITMDGYEMTVRVPTSVDLLEVAAAGDLDAARKHVLRRCVIKNVVRPTTNSRRASWILASLSPSI